MKLRMLFVLLLATACVADPQDLKFKEVEASGPAYSTADSIHWTHIGNKRRAERHAVYLRAAAKVQRAPDSTWHTLVLFKVVARFPEVGLRVWTDARDLNDDSTEVWFQTEHFCMLMSGTAACKGAATVIPKRYFLYYEPLCDVSHWDYVDGPRGKLRCRK